MRFVSSLLIPRWLHLAVIPITAAAAPAAPKPDPAPLRVAAISSLCLPGRVAENLDRHDLWTERAVARQARFVGFPECSITGYDFSPGAGIALDGPEVARIVALAIQHRIYLSAGLVEKREGLRYNTQLLAGPAGLLGVMRKVNLTKTEQAFFTAGRDFPLFDVDGVKVSIAICADATHFETVHVLALRGAQMIFVPHATYLQSTPQSWFDWRIGRWEWFARDACAFLVGCNNAGRYEAPREDEVNLRFASGALIIDPDGKVLQRSVPTTNVETMIIADISTKGVEAKRAELSSFNNLAMERFYGDLVKDSAYLRKPRH